MKVLVANHKLDTISGSETFTYTLAEELSRRGFEVEYFTFKKGITSDRLEIDLGIKYMSLNHYDLILANHNTCVNALFGKGHIIQTCHGIFPKLEKPSVYADQYVSISNEVQNYLATLGYPSTLIYNGINLSRFKNNKPINLNPKKILSLCQSTEANNVIRGAIIDKNIDLIEVNKYSNPVWNIEEVINDVDLVIGLGRSLYDAMACGRTVISFDFRHQYMDSYGDGYLRNNLHAALLNNCSGRYSKLSFDEHSLAQEIEKYSSSDSIYFRNFAEKHLCISKAVDQYINMFETYNIDNNIYLIKYLSSKIGAKTFVKFKKLIK